MAEGILDWAENICFTIWNDKNPGVINTAYRHNVRLHGLTVRPLYGRDEILSRAVGFLAEFPDIRWMVESSRYCSKKGKGFLVSFCWRMEGHYKGCGFPGSPTNSAVAFRGASIMYIVDKQILEQWEFPDDLALYKQLDLDPADTPLFREDIDEISSMFSVTGEPGSALGQDNADCSQISQNKELTEKDLPILLKMIWNGPNPGCVKKFYHKDCTILLPAGLELDNQEDYIAWLFSRLAPFSDLKISIDDVIGNLIRWTIQGHHRVDGVYGKPEGQAILISGISSYEINGGKISRELFLFREGALLRSISQNKKICSPASESDGNGINESQSQQNVQQKETGSTQ